MDGLAASAGWSFAMSRSCKSTTLVLQAQMMRLLSVLPTLLLIVCAVYML